MKKTFIILIIASVIFIGGCSYGKESQAMQSLNAQIENIQETISKTSTSEVVDVSPAVIIDANTTPHSLQSYKATAYNNMMKEEALRQDILSLNASLKSHTSQGYRLSTAQANSIIQLSNNISKNASKLEDSIGQVKNNVKAIKKSLNNEKISLSESETGYISLNNSMNERYAYMSNIYANLEQLYRLLEIENSPSQETENTPQLNQTPIEEEEKQGLKNIDTYISKNKNEPEQAPIQNQPNAVPPQNTPVENQPAPHTQYPPYNYNYYNTYNRGPFNPNRNTDTFYPNNRNIDTYRFNPNNYNYNGFYYNSYYNQPLKVVSVKVYNEQR
ncbi:MAG: hypothetical protein IJZ62_01335 [Clostridia bacterium]|nr:hypothetical protein [Clostridia bacterium]